MQNSGIVEQSTPLKVLFASETGNSAKVAEMIHIEALKRGYLSAIHELNSQGSRFDLTKPWDQTLPHICIIVSSSTGNGDAPKNGEKFVKFLRRNRKQSSLLTHACFCILGLGDSNYSQYQGVPIYIQEKMKAMGASQMCKRGEVDDAYGQPEDSIEPWLAKLWDVLDKIDHIRRRPRFYSNQKLHPKLPLHLDTTINYQNPARLRVQTVRTLTGPFAMKQIKEISLCLENAEGVVLFRPEVGGSISVYPENKEDDVLRFLSFFEFNLALDIINSPCVVDDLQKSRDLISQTPPLHFLTALKPLISDHSATLELYGLIENYEKEVRQSKKTVFEVLERVLGSEEKIQILNEEDFANLVHLLPSIKPRQYSVMLNGSSISFALSPHSFSVWREAIEIRKEGFCSHFLSNVKPGDEISCFPMSSSSIFNLPALVKTKPPLLLIAHGTSITPFVSFLREFVQTLEGERQGRGPVLLLYGFRSAKEKYSDFLYQKELEEIFRKLKEVYDSRSAIISAESYKELLEEELDESEVGEWRAGIRINTSYVQDLIVEEGQRIEEMLLKEEGRVYLCGEGRDMARRVEGNLELMLNRRLKQDVQLPVHLGNLPHNGVVKFLEERGQYRKETWHD